LYHMLVAKENLRMQMKNLRRPILSSLYLAFVKLTLCLPV
jgi:hypothetical protein